MGEPNELKRTKEEETKEAEESEEPSTIGDLPDEAAAKKVEEEHQETGSPSSRLDWAAISEFSELEELPMGPIRPRPKLATSENSSRTPGAAGIPEHQVSIETA